MGATTAITAAPSPAGAAGLSVIKVAMVPKLLGLPVFEANEKGAQSVVSKLGISFTYTAPATASAEGQVSIFDSLIAQHYNVITLSSDDPTVPAPVLQKAMKAGIQVITYDSDVPSARDFFIQDTAYNTIAEGVINAAVKFAGPSADVAIMSSTPDATIQLAWIGAMKSYIAAKYPKLKIVTIGYGQSNQATSLSQAEGIIHSYPNVKAILPIDGAAVVGTAQAVAALHDSGKIGVFGIGDPLPEPEVLRQRIHAGPVPVERGRPGAAHNAHGQARLRRRSRGTGMHGVDAPRQPITNPVVRDQDQLRQPPDLQRCRRRPDGHLHGCLGS
jgi:ABC-type sugar transport system substrate-binding protein